MCEFKASTQATRVKNQSNSLLKLMCPLNGYKLQVTGPLFQHL